MRVAVVPISEIMKDQQHNLSAGYWVNKKESEYKGFNEIIKEEQR